MAKSWSTKVTVSPILRTVCRLQSIRFFDLASVSKQFAGFAIATLVKEGKIKLQDDIRKYIPEIPDFGHTITINHLVHHTSGVRDWTSTLPLAGWSFDDVISFDHILNMIYNQKELNFEPGSEYTYSNSGYNILAELVQRVTGQTFRQWTDENIFKPLKMDHTFFLDDHTKVIPDRAIGYYRGNDGQRHRSGNNLMALGSSSLYSTTTDLARWVMNLDRPKPRMKEVVQQMFEVSDLNDGGKNNYAFGLVMGEFRGTKSISHSGGWASFRTFLVYFPEHRLSVVVLNNRHSQPFRLAYDIAALFIPDSSESQTTTSSKEEDKNKSAPTLSAEQLDEYVGHYRFGPGWYVEITRKNNQLWTQATNESKFPMTARQKEDHFWVEAYNRPMHFIRDQSGKIQEVKYAGKMRPKLNPTPRPSREERKNYQGTYYSDELDTKYTVTLEKGQLKLKHPRNGTLDLKHAWGEDFRGSSWFVNSVEFVRDDKDQITGFRVTQTRARNQFFKKIQDP